MKSQPLASRKQQARLLLVDDHVVMRRGLADIFKTYPAIKVVAMACTGEAALDEARRFRPNVVLTDLRLPDMTGIEVCRNIRSEMPQTQVIILTAFLDSEAVLAAVMAGANGFVLKSCAPDRLAEAIGLVLRGDAWLDGPAAKALLAFVRRAADCAVADHPMPLYQREKTVLSLLNEPAPGKSIADALHFREYIGPAGWS